jgi:hypothetical protein
VEFSFVNNPHVVQELYKLSELIPQFSVTVTETASDIHVFSLLEITPTQPLYLIHMS